ncbi:MAG: hypothetical protein C0592_02625 [Marinilabiliales bacterium]|nr:MAG: hypothetical protein C0592_02625 [Marinilabiliales bacterium]
MKNRILGILLIGLLVLPLVGTWMYLSHQKALLKKDVKKMIISGMDDDELELLVFTPAQAEKLKWKHSKEFEYKGQMYDVVRKENRNGCIYYWCWPDHEETALNNKIERVLAKLFGNDTSEKEKSQNIHRFYQSLYFSIIAIVDFSGYNMWQSLIYKDAENIGLGLCPEPPSPPPRMYNNS